MNIAQALAIRGEIDSYERQENIWLLSEILEWSMGKIKLNTHYILTDIQCQNYLSAVQRLNQGEPLAYILGHQPFWTLDLNVNQHTLIPRPDSEILVETILNFNLPSNAQVLDMGTGSGAIGLALASERPTWQMYLTDMSHDALKIAQENAKKHNICNVQFAVGEWYQAMSAFDHGQLEFDVIVSNPPYLAENDEHLDVLLKFEPKNALVAKDHGLADIVHIIQGAKQYIKNQGYVIVEHGWKQAQAVQHIFQQYQFQHITTIQDYGQNDRVTLAQWIES